MTKPDNGNRNPPQFRLLFMMLGLAMLLAPTGWNIAFQGSSQGYRSIALDAPVALSTDGVQSHIGDPFGAVAMLATLLAWQGEQFDPGEMVELLPQSTPREVQREHIREVFAGHGLSGDWLRVAPEVLYRLRQPFVAVFRADQPRLVLVREARQGFMYVFDPRVGNVLMDHDQFLARWGGLVFVLHDPPEPPVGS